MWGVVVKMCHNVAQYGEGNVTHLPGGELTMPRNISINFITGFISDLQVSCAVVVLQLFICMEPDL